MSSEKARSAVPDVIGIGSGAMTDGSDQYLTFVLADEEYGVDILRVQEIKGWDSVTQIPNTPEHVLGVLNLRGTIVPIIDLRLRFGLKKADYGPTTVIVVLRVEDSDGESRTMGLVVDAVRDVHNVSPDQMKDAPDFGGGFDARYVSGLATLDEKMIILLNIDRLLNASDLDAVDGRPGTEDLTQAA